MKHEMTLENILSMESEDSLIGLAVLAKLAFSGADLSPLGSKLLQRLEMNPNDSNALMDLSIILHMKGNRDLGIAMQDQALSISPLYRLGPDALPSGIRLLALVSPGDLTENNAVEFLVEGSNTVLDMLYVKEGTVIPENIPDHDVLIIAVSESDKNRSLLNHIGQLVTIWPKPVINLPDRIARLSRDGASSILKNQQGIEMPLTARIDRNDLEKIGNQQIAITEYISDANFPIIARPVDSHKGIGLSKLDTYLDVLDYLKNRSETEFYISRFIDYSGSDGLFRKYRIVFIDGSPFVCHMAISDIWLVHYLSAGMAENPERRDEEASFMASFDGKFAVKHKVALQNIANSLELEYVGIDCGETKDGKLLVFEVDTSMTIHSMDSEEIFPYKKVQMNKVFNAFNGLLKKTKNNGFLQGSPEKNSSSNRATVNY